MIQKIGKSQQCTVTANMIKMKNKSISDDGEIYRIQKPTKFPHKKNNNKSSEFGSN